jgi:hypothetical protein
MEGVEVKTHILSVNLKVRHNLDGLAIAVRIMLRLVNRIREFESNIGGEFLHQPQ